MQYLVAFYNTKTGVAFGAFIVSTSISMIKSNGPSFNFAFAI
jgi:hypothetical protein